MPPETTWIFGYGSLIWKIDFPFVRQQFGYIKGFRRRFWLSSTDHRGMPEFPGRVVTLVASEDPEDKVWGVAYEIPTDKKTQDDLDYREKGGYTRHSTVFHPTSSPAAPCRKGNAEATAPASNLASSPAVPASSSPDPTLAPLPPSSSPPPPPSSSLPPPASSLPTSSLPPLAPIPVVVFIASSEVDEYLGPQSLESLADVIAVSVGPSGRNADYLFNLAEAVRTFFPDEADDHLFELEEMVKERERNTNLFGEGDNKGID